MRLKIHGGKKLQGSIDVSGSKNGCLPLIAASIIGEEIVKLHNIPNIMDVTKFRLLLIDLGVFTYYEDHSLFIDARKLTIVPMLQKEMTDFRGSYYLIGALALKRNKTIFKKPGGCNLGSRPMDQHILACKAFGLEAIETENEISINNVESHGANFNFEKISFGATVNAILLASQLYEESIIGNYSKEPEIYILINYLRLTNVEIKEENEKLYIKRIGLSPKKITFSNMYDRIEAGSFITLGILTGDLKINNVEVDYLNNFFVTLNQLGVKIEIQDNSVITKKQKIMNTIKITSNFYPNFPTDLVPIIIPILLNTNKMTLIEDKTFNGRYSIIDTLNKLNVEHQQKGNLLLIHGSEYLKSIDNTFVGKDLRQTMAIIMIALSMNGEFIIDHADFVLRGYEDIIKKLININASIEEIKDE